MSLVRVAAQTGVTLMEQHTQPLRDANELERGIRDANACSYFLPGNFLLAGLSQSKKATTGARELGKQGRRLPCMPLTLFSPHHLTRFPMHCQDRSLNADPGVSPEGSPSVTPQMQKSNKREFPRRLQSAYSLDLANGSLVRGKRIRGFSKAGRSLHLP